MNILPAYALFLRYWYLLLSTPQRLVQVFIWSAFDIVLWGFVTKYLGEFGVSGINFTTILLGGLVFWQLITRIQQGFIMVFLEDSWMRNFLNLFASPISFFEYLLGLTISSLSTSVLAVGFGFLAAAWLFGMQIPIVVGPIVLISLILSLFAITLGMISSALVLRFGPTAEWFAWPIPAMIQPVVGVFYPISVLPGWAQGIAAYLPPAHAFEALRAMIDQQHIDFGPLFFAVLLATGYLLLAGLFFQRVYKWSLRTGAISRFGAESF
ncbi:MAG: hypothetical protein RIQ56_56 [Candidatus Parcubacteria bacterium]|jgi:ABC-2 type transport system permease protein